MLRGTVALTCWCAHSANPFWVCTIPGWCRGRWSWSKKPDVLTQISAASVTVHGQVPTPLLWKEALRLPGAETRSGQLGQAWLWGASKGSPGRGPPKLPHLPFARALWTRGSHVFTGSFPHLSTLPPTCFLVRLFTEDSIEPTGLGGGLWTGLSGF